LPFDGLPGWREVRSLPIAEQKRRLADPEVRRKLVEAEALMKLRVDHTSSLADDNPR
jgi:N-acyl-D-amino-acid deacylase